MANRPWLDEVRQRLAKHDLPTSYIQRFVEELTDHLEDLKEENMSTETNVYSRLGKPQQVAQAAVTAYRRRSFFDRHPTAVFLVFGVSPIASLLALFLLSYFGIVLYVAIYEHFGFNIHLARLDPIASIVLPYIISLLTIVIPGILACFCYCKLAKRLDIGRKWIVLSCTVLAAMALTPIWSVTLSETPGQSALRLGVGIPQGICDLPRFLFGYFCSVRQLFQFLVPLAVGLWFLRHTRDQEPRITAA